MSWLDKFQDGCTGVSYVSSLVGHKIEVEGCCHEHDDAYMVGGSYWAKTHADWKLAKCLFKGSKNKLVGTLRAGGALLVTSFFPYAYVVWKKK